MISMKVQGLASAWNKRHLMSLLTVKIYECVHRVAVEIVTAFRQVSWELAPYSFYSTMIHPHS